MNMKYTPLNLNIITFDNIMNTIEKKGYKQDGKNNNNYKNGISTYTQNKKSKCESCGSTKNLMVHHKDGNRKNNAPSNHITLCWSCHENRTVRKMDNNLMYEPKPSNLNWGVGCLIVNDKNEILLGKRTDNNLWGSPGGGVDDGETPVTAMIREIKEETNLDIPIPRYVGTIYNYNEDIIWTSFVFVIREFSGELKAKKDELSMLKWIPLEKLDNYDLFVPTIEALELTLQLHPEFLVPPKDMLYLDTETAMSGLMENEEIFEAAINVIYEVVAERYIVQKMTSIEQLTSIHNPGKNGGNGTINNTGWKYKKPNKNTTAQNKKVPRPTNNQIQVLKQSYIDYFNQKKDFKKIYKIQDNNFIFPDYNTAKQDGIVKDKKNYLTVFKEQFIHYKVFN